MSHKKSIVLVFKSDGMGMIDIITAMWRADTVIEL